MQTFQFNDDTTRTLLEMLEYAREMYGLHGMEDYRYTAFVKAEARFKKQSKLPVNIPVIHVTYGNQHINVTVK